MASSSESADEDLLRRPREVGVENCEFHVAPTDAEEKRLLERRGEVAIWL